MSSKKTSGSKAAIGSQFIKAPRRKRPGRHAKRPSPVKQTFFPTQGGK